MDVRKTTSSESHETKPCVYLARVGVRVRVRVRVRVGVRVRV